jgi:glycerophosphoryl diester phosphodiesterase
MNHLHLRILAAGTLFFAVQSVAQPVTAGGAACFDLQGHRGARGLMPENTLPAFDRALGLGVSTIETDLGLTRDGILVIAHDRRLNADLTRDSSGSWIAAPTPLIRDLTAVQLRSFDVGRLRPGSSYAQQWPQQQAVDGAQVPRLSELFALVKAQARPVMLNIETKLSPLAPEETASAQEFATAVVNEVRASGLLSRVTLQSFDWRTLRLAQKLEPQMRTACLTFDSGNSSTMLPDSSGASPWHDGLKRGDYASVPALVKAAGCAVWSPFYRNVDEQSVRQAQALGLKVIPWTVNEVADMQRLKSWGVDGLITDYPDRWTSGGVCAAR